MFVDLKKCLIVSLVSTLRDVWKYSNYQVNMVFVDLKEIFDSVPRDHLERCMEELKVPSPCVTYIMMKHNIINRRVMI